jgi:Ca-activated chloride channel family protein
MKSLAVLLGVGALGWTGLWFTPDQQGERLMARGDYAAAAAAFRDPMRQGVAWYRAGDFEKAQQAFARIPSAEAEYNRGNSELLLGRYAAAIMSYDRALESRPSWDAAATNRGIAVARQKMVERKGGDTGEQEEGADEIAFDRKDSDGGQKTDLDGERTMSDEALQSLWLRRIQTRPADFLKAKFSYQLAERNRGKSREESP